MNFCLIPVNAMRIFKHSTMLALLIIPIKDSFPVSVCKSTFRILRC